MSFLKHLKKNKFHNSNRWIVKFDKNLIKEVKLIYSPIDYKKNKNSKKLYNQNELIEILEYDKKLKNG